MRPAFAAPPSRFIPLVPSLLLDPPANSRSPSRSPRLPLRVSQFIRRSLLPAASSLTPLLGGPVIDQSLVAISRDSPGDEERPIEMQDRTHAYSRLPPLVSSPIESGSVDRAKKRNYIARRERRFPISGRRARRVFRVSDPLYSRIHELAHNRRLFRDGARFLSLCFSGIN